MYDREIPNGRAAAAVATVAATAIFLFGCSPGDYPGVLDKPTPRAGDPMTPDQIKAATDALLCDRQQLSAEVQADATPNGKPNASAAAATNTANCPQTAGVATKP